MTPLQEIEKGLAEGDLGLVSLGFEHLTGRRVGPSDLDRAALPARAHDALMFYSRPSNWKPGGAEWDPKPPAVMQDRGRLATLALEGVDRVAEPVAGAGEALLHGSILVEAGEANGNDDVFPGEPEVDTANPDPDACLSYRRQAPPIDPEGPMPNRDADAEQRQRVKAAVQAGGGFDIKQFQVQHGQGKGDGVKNYGRKEPFKPGMVNNFRDDGSLEQAASNFDRQVMAGLRPSPRRPPAETPAFVKATCSKCKGEFDTDPLDARVSADGEGKVTVCAECVKKAIKRGE